jgi:outer membrane protein X
MKSIFFKTVAIATIAVLTVGATARAQKTGDMAAGGNLIIGTGDHLTNFGIGGKFQYNLTTPLRLEGSFSYFLPETQGIARFAESKLSMWDLSVNGHWLFPVANRITVYPLAGLSVLGTKTKAKVNLAQVSMNNLDISASTTDFGFNFGGGVDYSLSKNLFLNAELKYKINGDWNRLLISAGVAYRF